MDRDEQPFLPSKHNEPPLFDLPKPAPKSPRASTRAWCRAATRGGKWHKRTTLFLTAVLLIITTLTLSGPLRLLNATTTTAAAAAAAEDPDEPPPRTVSLEAHIMSKCPDAEVCLHDLILPAMQRVGPRVRFRLSYIGNATDRGDGVECRHGPAECLGNIVELCVARVYPDVKTYLGFTMCVTKEYQRIPERALMEDCALEHGIDMGKVQDCTVDENGALSVELLQKSFRRSAEAGVTKSCTVRLNDEIRCIRDGGEWMNCPRGHRVDDLVKDIERLSALHHA